MFAETEKANGCSLLSEQAIAPLVVVFLISPIAATLSLCWPVDVVCREVDAALLAPSHH